MTAVADPHPDWTAQLAARFEAAAKDASAWLALIGWLARLALARIYAFGAAPDRLYGDLSLRRDLQDMVRLAETMLRVAISEAASRIAYYRVHPNEALPAWLRDGRAPRPAAVTRPPSPTRKEGSRLPSFRVSRWAPQSPRTAARAASAKRSVAFRPPSNGARARDDGQHRASPERRPGPSPARLALRLLAILKAMPNLQRYAWRLAKAWARRGLPQRAARTNQGETPFPKTDPNLAEHLAPPGQGPPADAFSAQTADT